MRATRLRTGAGTPASFDHLSGHHDRFGELVGRPLLDYLRERLPDRGGRAVDLGCGTGRHAAVLADHYDHVLGVDISVPMLELARTRRPWPNVAYQHRDMLDVAPGTDGTFDLVFSAYTLHHLPELVGALQHIRSLVRPGGQAILIDVCDLPRSRAWLRTEARTTLLLDLRHRRRPVREALQLYRLATHPAWLDHQTNDRLLPPELFEAVYRSVFRTAEITPLYRARAVRWTNGSG
jgi:SAM-dependent methyltransferase